MLSWYNRLFRKCSFDTKHYFAGNSQAVLIFICILLPSGWYLIQCGGDPKLVNLKVHITSPSDLPGIPGKEEVLFRKKQFYIFQNQLNLYEMGKIFSLLFYVVVLLGFYQNKSMCTCMVSSKGMGRQKKEIWRQDSEILGSYVWPPSGFQNALSNCEKTM